MAWRLSMKYGGHSLPYMKAVHRHALWNVMIHRRKYP